jgi:hypothetical protein
VERIKHSQTPKHSKSLHLDRLVERVTRNVGERRLTGAIFLDVTKAFDRSGSMVSF